MADTSRAFWGRVAQRYAAMPMRNPDGYAATLDLVRRYLRAEHNVLELGCGTGTTATTLAGSVARYVASDYAPEMTEIARAKIAASDLANLDVCTGGLGVGTLPTGPFDVILAFNLLHLLPDRPAAFAEIADMLPKGGLFLSKTPCLCGLWRAFQPLLAVLRWMGKVPHLRFLSPKQLEREIRSAGFEIVDHGGGLERSPRRFIVARKV